MAERYQRPHETRSGKSLVIGFKPGQVVAPEMNVRTESGISPDPSAIFACAVSLRDACVEAERSDPSLNLSESYNGMDQFMREMMRIGELFESWSCQHVCFDDLNDVWSYLLEDKFGDACLKVMLPTSLAQFDESDCLRAAMTLCLPVRVDGNPAVPLDVSALNPNPLSLFVAFRIQTVRVDLEDGRNTPFVVEDDPCNEDFGPRKLALYGVDADGLLEHITDRANYADAFDLVRKIAPGINFPVSPTFLNQAAIASGKPAAAGLARNHASDRMRRRG